MSLDGGVEHGNMTLNSFRHDLTVPLPQGGAARDVSEEEGDGAGGEIGHIHPQFVLSPVTTVRTPSHYRRPQARAGNRPANARFGDWDRCGQVPSGEQSLR